MPSPRAACAPRACCTLALLAACVDSHRTTKTSASASSHHEPHRPIPIKRRLWPALVFSLACGVVDPPLNPGTSTSDVTGGHSETGAATDVPTGTTSAGTTTTSTTSNPHETSGSTTASLDMPSEPSCDPWVQDCPPGEKCAWYGSLFDETKCEPIMEDPAQLGENCFVEVNILSGVDNCDLGLMCWDTDEENQGFCIALCTGTPEAPACATGNVCRVYSSGMSHCIDACDPLSQDCPADRVCIVSLIGDGFACELDGSGDQGQAHDPCTSANSCDPGLLCLDSDAAEECDPRVFTCCEPICDLTLPNTCPGQGQQCIPVFETDPPPEYANVGICSLPP